MENLNRINDVKEKAELIKKHIDINVASKFQDMIVATAAKWNGEPIADWDIAEIGGDEGALLFIPSEEKEYRALALALTSNPEPIEVDALTFGVALSCTVFNHFAWFMEDNYFPSPAVIKIARCLNNKHFFIKYFICADEPNIEGVDIGKFLTIID